MADNQKSGTAAPLERLGHASGKKKRDCDANNNASADQLSGSGSGGSVGTLDKQQARSFAASCEHLTKRRRESNLSESTDDWHLLDVDEQLSSSSSSCEFGAQSAVRGVSSSVAAAAQSQHDSRAHFKRQQESQNKNQLSFDSTCGSTPSKQSNKMTLDAASTRANTRQRSDNVSASSSSKHQQFIVVDQAAKREQLNASLIYLCTALYSLMPLASLLTFVCLIYLLLFTKLWPVTLIYYSYLLIDCKTCNRGGRRLDWVYRSKFWTYLAAYFPISLRYSRNFKLSSSENYILNYHPHGISALGCVSAFATNGLGFSELFPGIRARFMVHETSFLVPIMRETFGLRGDCSVNSASFDYILSQKWSHQKSPPQKQSAQSADGAGGRSHASTVPVAGNLLALCGGGLAEADLSDMETLKIVCATRKGFVKKALIHGAHLVPCIAFGENSVFKKVNLRQGSLLQKLEAKWYQLFKFRHPIYYGASLLAGPGSKLRGTMPFKRPITVCMADPIAVQRVEQPSQKQIDQLHALYIERLTSLYTDNRDLCDKYDCKIELL